MVCDFNCRIVTEGHLKVTGSHYAITWYYVGNGAT